MFVAKVQDNDLRRAQSAWQLANFLKNTDSYKGTNLLDSETKEAFRIVSHATFYQLAEKSEKLGYGHIQAALMDIMDSEGYDYDVHTAAKIITAKLAEARHALAEHPEFQEKLDTLKTAFETALPSQALEMTLAPEPSN